MLLRQKLNVLHFKMKLILKKTNGLLLSKSINPRDSKGRNLEIECNARLGGLEWKLESEEEMTQNIDEVIAKKLEVPGKMEDKLMNWRITPSVKIQGFMGFQQGQRES